jgi:hypothetical protein
MIARLQDRNAVIDGVRDEDDPLDLDPLVVHERNQRVEVVRRHLDVLVASDQNISRGVSHRFSLRPVNAGDGLSPSQASSPAARSTACSTARLEPIRPRESSPVSHDPLDRRMPRRERVWTASDRNRILVSHQGQPPARPRGCHEPGRPGYQSLLAVYQVYTNICSQRYVLKGVPNG